MRDAELSPALMRLYLIGGWPVVEQFPLYMSQNLLKPVSPAIPAKTWRAAG